MEPFDLIATIAAAQDGVVTAEQALDAGLTRDRIRQLCRSGRWQRFRRGIYLLPEQRSESAEAGPGSALVLGRGGAAPFGRGPTMAQGRRALIRAAVTALGPGATAVLRTAADLHGMAGLPGSQEIHVSVPVPRARAPRHVTTAGIMVHQLALSPGDVCEVDGIATTSPLRTVADVMLRADRCSAVCLLDSALNRRLVQPDDLAAVPALLRRRPGAVAARRFLAQADGRAQSPLETRVRLRCVDARVPPDDLQYAIRDDDGYLLGVADMVWRRARVAAEADGTGPHSTLQALYEDRRRQNRLANAGWTVLRFTWADAMRPDYIPFVVRNALRLRVPLG